MPLTSKNEPVAQTHDVVQRDKRLTICEVVGKAGISYDSCPVI